MPNADTTLKVAAVQFRSSADLDDNLARIRVHLARLRGEQVRVVAFPECAATSYDGNVIERTTEADLLRAEKTLADACREFGVYTVIGIPYFENGARYNGAVIWDPDGACIGRYAKIQLAGEPWCASGDRFVVFPVDGVLCSVIVCHDERYPELCRLPVLAGAQMIFYISCESNMIAESKVDTYRAQIQARAMENVVYVVHSNAPMGEVRVTNGKAQGLGADSNGHSRIIRPDGHIIAEASIWGEDVLIADLDMKDATRSLAERSRQSPFLKDWWEAGLSLVRMT